MRNLSECLFQQIRGSTFVRTFRPMVSFGNLRIGRGVCCSWLASTLASFTVPVHPSDLVHEMSRLAWARCAVGSEGGRKQCCRRWSDCRHPNFMRRDSGYHMHDHWASSPGLCSGLPYHDRCAGRLCRCRTLTGLGHSIGMISQSTSDDYWFLGSCSWASFDYIDAFQVTFVSAGFNSASCPFLSALSRYCGGPT